MEEKYIRDFREIIRIFEQEIYLQNTASCCNGISLAQCHTLLEIQNKSRISVSELAQNMRLDKSTVSRTVDNLVKMDLVDRAIPEENRRMAQLNLTNEGKEVCKSIHYTNDNYIRSVLQDFSENECAEFLVLFRRMTQNMVNARD